MLNGHAVRISVILCNPHIREYLFLLAEIVGGGITPDEVLKIYSILLFDESIMKLSSKRNSVMTRF